MASSAKQPPPNSQQQQEEDDEDKKPAATAPASPPAAPPLSNSISDDGGDHATPSEPQDKRSLERKRALKEAKQVLESTGGMDHLDTFHLLGVVADPRGPGSHLAAVTSSSSLPNSFHGRYTSTATTASDNPEPSATTVTGSAAAALFGSTGASYYQSFESTLTSMTGQMEALNSVLEDWSRYIVEEGDYGVDELEMPQSQLKELPPEIANLDTSTLQSQYLDRSGAKAAAFHQIMLSSSSDGDLNKSSSNGTGSSSRSLDAVVKDKDGAMIDVSDIPDTFFDPNFDLTNPNTFRDLLLQSNDNGDDTAEDIRASLMSTSFNEAVANTTDGPISEWFPLLPQDALSGHVDKVELALLQQVRANSGQFFAESQRFALLQEWVQSMLQQVIELQAVTRHLKTDLLQPMQTVPVADAQRADLRRLELVLERAEDMMLCKHSLGGVLSAQDDLTAIEQISYGRRLLEGRTTEDTDDDDNEEPTRYRVELGRLHSFKTVADQLNQYEQLVVSNLREELVETFLSWNSSTSSSYGGSGTTPASAAQQHQQPDEEVRKRVCEISGALKSCRALSKTKEAFSTRLQDVIRMTVRTIVGEFAADVTPNGAVQSVAMSTSSMTLPTFLDCLDMLFEQLLGLINSAASVDEFFVSTGLTLQDDEDSGAASTPPDQHQQQQPQNGSAHSSEAASDHPPTAMVTTPLKSVVIAAAELMSKSISELLRIRKDAHALITLDEVKTMSDSCMNFASELDRLSGSGNTSALRSTLLAQAKTFVERKHEGNMAALAAALDSERWVQSEVSVERQDALTRLCTGRTILSPMKRASSVDVGAGGVVQKSQEIEAEGTRYKVVWSCLLLVEMVLNNIATATHFPSLSSSIVGKVSDILRLFNSRTTHLVLGAGAIHSHAKLKSINAKHLSLVTQCLGMIMAILPHIRAALMAQLPKKQHTLLTGLDQIRKEYGEHNEKVLNKFVSIIGGIIEHGLAKKISGTDFDVRATKAPPVTDDGVAPCCVFLEGVSTNTRKMHQVLYSLLPPDHLKDTFSRIFAFIDTKVPALFISAANIQPVFQKQSTNSPKNPPAKVQPSFIFPKTDEGKRRFLLEVETMTKNLNGLDGVHPWDFTVTNVLERRLEYSLEGGPMSLPTTTEEPTSKDPAAEDQDAAAEKPDASPSSEQPVEDSDNENSQVPDGKAAGATANSADTGEAAPLPETDSEKKDESTVTTTGEQPEASTAAAAAAPATNGEAPAEDAPKPDSEKQDEPGETTIAEQTQTSSAAAPDTTAQREAPAEDAAAEGETAKSVPAASEVESDQVPPAPDKVENGAAT